MIDKLTLIVPTHNRQSYFRRLFRYYAKWPGRVILVDSTAKRFSGVVPANIAYINLPDSNFVDKIIKGIEFTNSPYLALCADDDIMIYDGVMSCISSLDSSGASICTGQILKFYRHEYGKYQYSHKSIESDLIYEEGNIGKRFLSEYQLILWSVFRAGFLESTFRVLKDLGGINDNFIELILGCAGQENGGVIVKAVPLVKREIADSSSWGKVTLPLYYMKRHLFELELKRISRALLDTKLAYNFESDVSGYINEFQPRFSSLRGILYYSKITRIAKTIIGSKEIDGMSRESWV